MTACLCIFWRSCYSLPNCDALLIMRWCEMQLDQGFHNFDTVMLSCLSLQRKVSRVFWRFFTLRFGVCTSRLLFHGFARKQNLWQVFLQLDAAAERHAQDKQLTEINTSLAVDKTDFCWIVLAVSLHALLLHEAVCLAQSKCKHEVYRTRICSIFDDVCSFGFGLRLRSSAESLPSEPCGLCCTE